MHEPMQSRPLHQLIVLACLAAFCIGQVLGSATVRCTDAAGVTRVEFACPKDQHGQCTQSCDLCDTASDVDEHSFEQSDGSPSRPAPCTDEPFGKLASGTRTSTPNVCLEPATGYVALNSAWSRPGVLRAESVGVARIGPDRARPPGGLSRAQTPILLI